MRNKLTKALCIAFVSARLFQGIGVYAAPEKPVKLTELTELTEEVLKEKQEIPEKDIVATKNAVLTTEGDALVLEVTNENGALKIENLDLDTETKYAIHFKYQKIDGELRSFGGHTDGLFLNNIVAVDGKTAGLYEEMDSAFVKDDKEEHEVVVEFLTPRDKASASFYIQPNRGDFEFVTIKITDLYIVEIPED